MKDKELLERITINPKVMVGKPVIRGTRLTVNWILMTNDKDFGNCKIGDGSLMG